MPLPWTYRHAAKERAAFLADAKEGMCLDSDNSACTTVQGVFLVFCRRVTPVQGIAFA